MLSSNDLILNRLFTQGVLFNLINTRGDSVYSAIVNRYLGGDCSQKNSNLIRLIYKKMEANYRNEYVYKNIILKKILLGRHSLKTTTALAEVPVKKSKADFVLINGKAVVYEIKTELDTLERVHSQIDDYFSAFANVCIVTSEKHSEKLLDIYGQSAVGVCVLTSKNTISLKKKPVEDRSRIDPEVIFKILNKAEYESIINCFYGALPDVPNVFYYKKCLELFKAIPVDASYELFLSELKKRNTVLVDEFVKTPDELKAIVYFSKFKKNDYFKLEQFLDQKFGV